MAEIRKYQPSTSAVSDAIRAALGDSVRPVAPGSTPPEQTEKDAPSAAVTTRTFTFGTGSKHDA